MTLAIALAGAGMVSRHHLRAWAATPGARVVAIADPDRDAARARAAEFAVPEIFADAREMLARRRPDALDIAAPMGAHAELIDAALEAGLSGVLCQKPLAPDLDRARAVAERAAAQPGTRLMIHENWRFRPHYRRIAAWLGGGAIGAPRLFRLESLGSGLLPGPDGRAPGLVRQPFLARMERLVVLELLVHHLDTLAFLLGPLVPRAAALTRLSPLVRGEDTALVQLTSDGSGGPLGALVASMAAPGAPARPHDALLLHGEVGRIVLDGDELSCEGKTVETLRIDHERDYEASYAGAIGHFAEAMTTGAEFETGPQAHLAVMEAVETIYRLSGADAAVA